LTTAIRGAQLRVIEGAGHLSNLENAPAFNAALIEFLLTLNRLPEK
jgi:pimeloyl-ACP methyl ester carboxylesterase